MSDYENDSTRIKSSKPNTHRALRGPVGSKIKAANGALYVVGKAGNLIRIIETPDGKFIKWSDYKKARAEDRKAKRRARRELDRLLKSETSFFQHVRDAETN